MLIPQRVPPMPKSNTVKRKPGFIELHENNKPFLIRRDAITYVTDGHIYINNDFGIRNVDETYDEIKKMLLN